MAPQCPALQGLHLLAWLTQQLPKTLARADFLITDSESVRQELIDTFAVAPERVHSVYLGADASFKPHTPEQAASVMQRYGLRHGAYVLFVGTLEPRKGVDLLIDALVQPARRHAP